MPKYLIKGTAEVNWSVIVDAENKKQAEIDAKEMVEDGNCDWDLLVDEPEITLSEKIK